MSRVGHSRLPATCLAVQSISGGPTPLPCPSLALSARVSASCATTNAVGATKPNVAHVAPGDIVLLAYGRGRYEPQLYLQVEPSPDEPLARTLAMTRLTGEVADRLAAAGYRLDPKLGSFTGWRVTPCGDWRGQLPAVLKPGGNNFLRRWSEVRAVNGW